MDTMLGAVDRRNRLNLAISAMAADSGYTPAVSRTLLGAALAGTTKTGNGHAPRLLVEAAWHRRPRYQPGADLRSRWEQASPAARARGQQANRRLHARWPYWIPERGGPVHNPVASVIVDSSGDKVGSPPCAAGTPSCPPSSPTTGGQ